MSEKKVISDDGNLKRTVESEDGINYRRWSQNFDPIIQRVEYLKNKVNEAGRAENRHGYKYLGSVPIALVADWLNKHNYSWHDFAVNAGGEKGKTNPGGPGVKDKFMKYFMSRDFAKLHTQHVTSKASDSGIIYTGKK